MDHRRLDNGELLQADLVRAVIDRVHCLIRELRIDVCNECVVLHGRSDTYYAKQLAQQAVLERGPFEKLENHIVVADRPSATL